MDTNYNFESKIFVITFSVDEWEKIQPQRVKYNIVDKKRPNQHFKSYKVLPKNT